MTIEEGLSKNFSHISWNIFNVDIRQYFSSHIQTLQCINWEIESSIFLYERIKKQSINIRLSCSLLKLFDEVKRIYEIMQIHFIHENDFRNSIFKNIWILKVWQFFLQKSELFRFNINAILPALSSLFLIYYEPLN